MQHPIDERCGHRFMAEHFLAFREALVEGQHAEGMLARFITKSRRRVGPRVNFLQGYNQIDQSSLVHEPAALGAAIAKLIAKCVLPTPCGPNSATFALRSIKQGSCRLTMCSRLIEGLEGEVEGLQRLDHRQAGDGAPSCTRDRERMKSVSAKVPSRISRSEDRRERHSTSVLDPAQSIGGS
jgi:hypothetical protein